MALTVEVTNGAAVEIGRVGYVFEPGEPKECKDVPSSRINELTDHPDLTVEVISADSPNEIPPGVEYRVNATPDAKELAKDKGIDILSLKGSGKNGRVTKQDVEKAVKAETGESGGGNLEGSSAVPGSGPSTHSSEEAQRAAERADAERIRGADAMDADTPPGPTGEGASEPDQTGRDTSSSVGPSAGDVPTNPAGVSNPTGVQRREP
jgi:pyruvate/2-oxoglutarate dehydrogenase complex dihydrolipoamide acyltransferase (E2) component